jgi:hypothetical protein
MARFVTALLALALLAPAVAGAKVHTIIRWSKTGGVAGVTETLFVKSNNVAYAGHGRESGSLPAQLSAKQVRRLRDALDEARLATLKPSYPAPGAADTFQYSVTYRGHTVRADETKVPKRLRRALALLQKTYDDIFASSE